MAGYSTSAPPTLIAQAIAGQRFWSYNGSTDNAATRDAANYITNAVDLGMKAGDVVFGQDSDDTNFLTAGHTVVSVASTGADLSDGSTIAGSANAD